jgi:hypothetical protein
MEDNNITPWIIEPENDCFTPDEKDENDPNKQNENPANTQQIIIKQKITIDEFYSTVNKNHCNLKSENVYIRNYTSYKLNNFITFHGADIKVGILDLYTNIIFRTTIDWVNFIDYIFDKSL